MESVDLLFSTSNNKTDSDEFKISFNRPFKCQWTSKVEYKDWIYCSGNVFILFGALISTVILIIILVKHLR